MGDHHSLAVYTALFRNLLQDVADHYTDSEFALDWSKIQSRITSEGIGFLTKTLPRIGKIFDLALQGETQFCVPGLQKQGGSQLPKLFGWLFNRVFNPCGGLRCVTRKGDAVDPNVVKHVRQLLYFMYKLELPYDSKTEKSVLDSFVAVEAELAQLHIPSDDPVIQRARVLITRVLGGTSPKDIVPRHGPGVVASGERGAEKSAFRTIYRSIDQEFPFTEYYQLGGQVCDNYHDYDRLRYLDSGIAKVILVPKDSRGPRLISCEPLEYQWIQQGLQRLLYKTIEAHPLTRGRVNFTDQMVNREHAYMASLTGHLVTLDMKEASDRVSVALVVELFRDTGWLPSLLATRTTRTRLPDGRIVFQNKFAPMGSAVCFPIEALCFWALSVASISTSMGIHWREANEFVWVYGDDIITLQRCYNAIMTRLPLYGLMFNKSKCCVSGFFRESCGCDAFRGVDVTPIRCRKTWYHAATYSNSNLQSWVELSNSLHDSGYYRAADYIQGKVDSLYGNLPYFEYSVSKDWTGKAQSSVPGLIGWRRSDVNHLEENRRRKIKVRYNLDLQRLELFGYTQVPVYENRPESGWGRCLRNLCCGTSRLQFGTYAVAHRSRLKRTWGQAF